jgi:hypothetical protein
MFTGLSRTLTLRYTCSILLLPQVVMDGSTTLARVDLPYIWAPQGRHKVYWFYLSTAERKCISGPE